MSKSNFARCLEDLLKHEGGNDDDPQDPGGRTSRGIIQTEYNRYRQGKGLATRDVWKADQSEVLEIYRIQYWDAMRCDELPAGIEHVTFDYGVNSGTGRAPKVLQRVLGVGIDGKIGDETLKAARAADAEQVINAICDERLAFLQGLSTWARFGRGWSTRVGDVRTLALKLAAEAPEEPEDETKPSLWQVLIDALTKLFGKKDSTPVDATTDLAGRIVAAMKRHNYRLDTAPGQMNIAYVEGMSPEGVKNDNAPNEFNDARFVITFDGGKPKIAGCWQATTEPGTYWTQRPMNPGGAARIKFGQYTAWRVGQYHEQEALLQVSPITVCRDLNKDYKRTGDKEDTGMFGIYHHWGYDLPQDDLGNSSAGCLVGRMRKGHMEFMAKVKSDPRYVANHSFVFTAAVLPSAEI